MNGTFYDVAPTNFIGRIGLKFLEALDLSNNLVKVTKALKGVPNGMVALVLAIGCALAVIGFGSLAYYFDIDSTFSAMAPLRQKVTTVAAGLAGAAFLGWLVQFVPTAITVLPTVSEMLGARFARFNVPAFQAATWLFIFWDLATDIPRVNENINPYWSNFVQGDYHGFFGILFTFNPAVIGGAIGFYVVWVLALLGASYFLELITILALWGFVGCLWKSFGYWAARVLASRGNFRGDLGGEFDDDFEGDDVHSAEAFSFGHTGRPASRQAPRRSGRGGGGARRGRGGRGGSRPIYGEAVRIDPEDDEFGPRVSSRGRGGPIYADDLDDDWDDLGDIFGEDTGRGGPRRVWQ